MIGLMEPKYLPGGAQTQREQKGALRGVRFETHVKRKGEEGSGQEGERGMEKVVS
jgi:hypothetical protein